MEKRNNKCTVIQRGKTTTKVFRRAKTDINMLRLVEREEQR